MHTPSATENPNYVGFYEIPGFSNYVISLEGIVVNKTTGRYLSGSKNTEGYHFYHIPNDAGIPNTTGRHRLLLIAFKYPGSDVDSLWVNHKNGIKGDDRLDNLEWVTPVENMHHAGAMGLTAKCIPISVRDIDTGVILKFPSIIDCARYFGMTKDAIQYRVSFGEYRVFPERKQYRASHNDDPWYIPDDIERKLLENGIAKKVYLRYVLTGEILEFDKLTDLANHLGLAVSTVSIWLTLPNQPVFPGFVMVKWSHDLSPWREIGDPYLEFNNSQRIYKCIQVVNDEDDTMTVYGSAIECAKVHNLKPTALNFRLKSNGKTVFRDGYRYGYYPYKI